MSLLNIQEDEIRIWVKFNEGFHTQVTRTDINILNAKVGNKLCQLKRFAVIYSYSVSCIDSSLIFLF